MATEEQSTKRAQYQSYEEFRRKFYGSRKKSETTDLQENDDTASFGKRLASELVRQND
jgi:hypothetical protein